MVQIKLSIAFVLVAAAIAPIVAQPVDLEPKFDNALQKWWPSKKMDSRDEAKVAKAAYKLSKEQTDSEKDKASGHKHAKRELVEREYTEFDEMFERADFEDIIFDLE